MNDGERRTMDIKDIAKTCGVSVSTVSRAINNHPDVNPETKKQILAAIEKYHYIPNNSARNLKRSNAKSIAVLVKGLTNTFFNGMIDVIQRETEKRKYTFILQRVDEDEDEIIRAIELLKEKKPMGIIFLGGFISHEPAKMRQLSVPFVICTSGLEVDKGRDGTPKWSAVSVDDFQESYKMTDYLCRIGHTKIAIIAADEKDQSIGGLRFNGYMKALKDHHIEVNEKLICHMDGLTGTYEMSTGYRLMKRLLETKEEFTAVYAISDSLALGACRALAEAKKRIPEDCSVAGFDGIEMDEYYNPSLTTIRQPAEQMAQTSIDILFSLMEGGKNCVQCLPGELLARESTRKLNQ